MTLNYKLIYNNKINKYNSNKNNSYKTSQILMKNHNIKVNLLSKKMKNSQI